MLETNLQLVFKRRERLRSCLCLGRASLRLIASFHGDRLGSSTKRRRNKKKITPHQLIGNLSLAIYLYLNFNKRPKAFGSRFQAAVELGFSTFCLRVVKAGCSSGAHRPLPDREGQPGGAAAPFHRAGPQARVGAVQRVCAHHQELHPHVHRRQTRVVRFG